MSTDKAPENNGSGPLLGLGLGEELGHNLENLT